MKLRSKSQGRWISRLSVVFMLSAGSQVSGGVNFWTERGPGIAPVEQLAACKPSQVMFAQSKYQSYRSTDQGTSWQLLRSLPADSPVTRIVCDPTNPDIVYALSGPNFLQSTDRGTTWKVRSSGLLYGVQQVAVDPAKGNILYAWDYRDGILRSSDHGFTWRTILSGDGIRSFSVDRNIPGRLFVDRYFKRRLISEDRGESWRETPDSGFTAENIVTFDSDPKRLYAAYGSSLHRSTDGGNTWKMLEPGVQNTILAMAAPPDRPNLLYVSSWTGLFRTTDGGESWAQLADVPAHALLFDSEDPNVLFAATGGVFKIHIDTWTWEARNAGLRGGSIALSASDPAEPGRIYAAGGDLHVSTDGGRSWKSANNGLEQQGSIEAIEIDPGNTSTLYAGLDGVFKSTDSGQNWVRVDTGIKSVTDILVDPRNSSVVYAASGYVIPSPLAVDKPIGKSQYQWGPTGALYKSTDAGATWATPSSQLTNVYVSSLGIDPANSSVLYATTWRGLFKSTDAGLTWAVSRGGQCFQVLVSRADSRRIAVLSEQNVSTSTDAGQTWFTQAAGNPDILDHFTRLAMSDNEPAILYAGTNRQGIMRSTDFGATWKPFNRGLRFDPNGWQHFPGINDIHIAEDQTLWAASDEGLQSLTPVDALFVPRLLHRPNAEWTGIALTNRGSEDRTVRISVLDRQGKMVWGIKNPFSVELRPGEQKTLLTADLYASSAGLTGWLRIDGAKDDVKGFFSTLTPDLEVFDTSSADSLTGNSFTFANTAGRATTEFWIANPNPDQTEIWFELRDSSGRVKQGAVSRTIPGQGLLIQKAEELSGSGPLSETDYVQCRSDEPVVSLACFEAPSQFVSMLPAQYDVDADSHLFAPQFAQDAGVSTEVTLISNDPVPGTARVRLVNDAGQLIGHEREVAMAPYGRIVIGAGDFFGLPPGSPISGYLEVASAWVQLTGSVRFSDPAGQTFASALPLIDHGARLLVFSHLVSTADDFTGLALVNLAGEDAHITIQILRPDGTVLVEKQEQLLARERVSRLITEYFPELRRQTLMAGTIRVNSDQELAAFALFGPYSLRSLAAIPAQ